MTNIENLERQHSDIRKDVLKIHSIIDGYNLEERIDELVTSINVLSGRLVIHLGTEDKFLYPKLLVSTNADVKKLAEKYIKEMSGFSNKFIDFKNRFNTKSKISSDTNAFLAEIKEIFKLLEDRLNKEDNELYPLLK